jgi:pimeloyl-ACP methyl ester carboxylesterase
MNQMRLLVLTITILGTLAARPAVLSVPPLELKPCHIDRLPEEILCGVHTVFEDRQAGTGAQIPIHVAVLPPLRRAIAPDPLLILSGGPGQGARSLAVAAARYFKQVRRTRAIVLVDLRGTGSSGALKCLDATDELSRLDQGADVYLGTGAACLAALGGDPRHYTHTDALADLDEIRRRLGYARVNLWGGSWGTRAALLYALTYPDAVRSVVLDGAVALNLDFPDPVATNAQRAMDLLVERCAADAACARAFPDPHAELRRVLDSLTPARRITIRHPRTGADATLVVSRDTIAELARVALYTTTDGARLFQTIRHAAHGDFGPLAAQYVQSARTSTDDMALGATMAILCSEDLQAPHQTIARDEAAATFVGDSYADAWRRRCRGWPVGPPIAFDRGAVSAAHALILSGLNDPVTPPSAGEAMARHFTSVTHIVVPGAAHNASFTGCVPKLIASFLEKGRLEPDDAACVKDVPLPPIVANDAGGLQ